MRHPSVATPPNGQHKTLALEAVRHNSDAGEATLKLNEATTDILTKSKKALDPESVSSKKCFLCGEDASSGLGEHVFPTWLQSKFGIRDQKLNLLNGTTIAYRNLRVPACISCNTTTLSKTESIICRLQASDLVEPSDLNRFEIARWMAKIWIGILMAEARLPLDRQKPDSGNIFNPKHLDELFLLHLFVQSWRKPAMHGCLHGKGAFSLYTFPLVEDESYANFHFSTNFYGQSVCIRFGQLGIAFVGDGGLQNEIAEVGPFGLNNQILHPIQFDEMAARIHYKASLRDATHDYVHTETPTGIISRQLRVIDFSGRLLEDGSTRIFRDWSNFEFAKFIEMYRVPGWEHLIDQNGEASFTRLVKNDGTKITL